MDRRLQLHELLKSLLGSDHAYFQPPENLRMEYPCIVYRRDAAHNEYAGNRLYLHSKRYQVTVIDRNPDSDIPDKIAALPLCAFAQHFVTEQLHHDVFSLYF